MSNYGKVFMSFFSRSTKFVGRNVSRFARATKSKSSEFSDLNKRRELIYKLGETIYTASQEGLSLPEGAADIAQQIAGLDADLEIIRADRAAQKAAYAQERAEEKAARAAEKAAAKAAAAIEKSTTAANIRIPEPVMPAAELEDATDSTEAPSSQVTTPPAAETDNKAYPDVPTLNV